MRLYEFANAQEQLALWKLISDSVWNSIKLQAIEQEQKRINLQKTQPKSAPRSKTVKKPKTVAAPKPTKLPKKRQKSSSQTQKPQVLPNVFTSTARSNPVQPQTPVTSASSLATQNSLKTRPDRLRAPDSVAGVQRQLDPLASSDAVKRLTR
jgi:hypothetical protein